MLDTTTSLMVMLTVVDLEPTELLAQIVNTAPVTTTLGVPQIVPLLVSNVRPEGNEVLIAHVDTLPLVLLVVIDGATEVIAVP